MKPHQATTLQVTTSVLAALCLGLRLPASPPSSVPVRAADGGLKEERIYIEYTLTNREATVVVEAESELPMTDIFVVDSLGRSAFRMLAQDARGGSLQGFRLESTERPLQDQLQAFGAGEYEVRARSNDGRWMGGHAVLDHQLPRAPYIAYPTSSLAPVPTNLTVSWTLVPDAVSYEIVFEQNNNDGIQLTLPGDRSSFRVPDGLLRPGTTTLFEVAAVAANGNKTVVEVEFVTAKHL